MSKKRYKEEIQVLTEMIEWLDKRIDEMKGEAPAYKEMKESLVWKQVKIYIQW